MTDSEGDDLKTFTCLKCGLAIKFDYFGTKPPFLKSLNMMEKAYVMRDPFSSDNGVIILGSECAVCNRPVCCDTECSLFYSKRFCLDCVYQHLNEFPSEIRQEVLRKHQKKTS